MNRNDRMLVGFLIAFAVVMACGWAYALPIFLNPDEDSHYDYALTLFSSGRAMHASENVVGRDTHPSVEYLMRETHARQQRLDVAVGADAGYGTIAYFRKLDAGAPVSRPGGPINPAPYISRLYPIGYYALVASTIALGNFLIPHSVVAQFFSARFLSVVLLIPTLWFGWLALLELPLTRGKAKAIFVCLPLMPLTLWMAASVQPDVMVCALVAPIAYAALRLRRDPTHTPSLVILGLLLAMLVATKRHYFLALYIPVAAMLAVRLPWRSIPQRAIAALAFVSLPAAAALAWTQRFLHTTAVPVGLCQGPSALSIAARGGPSALMHFYALGLQRVVRTTFLDDAGRSFWLNYTAYGNTPIEIVSKPFTAAVSAMLPTLSVLVAILFLARLARVWRALFAIGMRRSWRSAARIATSNVLINSFIVFIALVYGFEISIGGEIGMQGRYWLPFLPAIWLVTFEIAPRALAYRLRIPASRVAFAIVFTFGILATSFTFPSLHQRFYAPSVNPPPSAELTTAIWADVSHGSLNVNGVAYDLRTAGPAASVVLEIDGRRRIGTTAFDRADVECDMERTLLHVGYRARIPANQLRPGTHTIDVLVRTPWHNRLIDTGTRARIIIS